MGHPYVYSHKVCPHQSLKESKILEGVEKWQKEKVVKRRNNRKNKTYH